MSGANRDFYRIYGTVPEYRIIAGNVALSGTTVGGSMGFGVSGTVRNNTGSYTMTLSDSYPALLASQFMVMSPSGTLTGSVQMSTASVTGTTPTIQFRLHSGSVLFDPANEIRVMYTFHMKNTNLTK